MPGLVSVNGLLVEIIIPLRFVLASILIASSIEKLRNISGFAEGVKQYQVLPSIYNQLYAYTLPWIELFLGSLFIIGFALKIAATLSICVFLSFAVAVTINLVRQRNIPCFCFGADNKDRLGWQTLARIILLLISSIAIYLSTSYSNPWLYFLSPYSKIHFGLLFTNVVLTIFGILMLSLVDVLPWVIKAWTAPTIRPPCRSVSYTWYREPQDKRSEEA
jgi:uncharacterized membrane protein YphA (DoxX/SURF4 family)